MTAPQSTMAPPSAGDMVEQLLRSVQQAIAAEPDPVADASAKTANEKMQPNAPEDAELVEPIERRRAMMSALYGPDFPFIAAIDAAQAAGATSVDPRSLMAYTEPDDWCQWARNRWDAHRASVATHLWMIQRNRLFRAGQQWVSSKGHGPWREPPKQAESARPVHNIIDKALDQRVQVMTDQRPGFEVEPSTVDPDEKRKAEGRQQALEYIYDANAMQHEARSTAYWAGTDGVSFWHVYWDRDAGPWDTRMAGPGEKGAPLGDLRTQTLRCEQVRVSSNATATADPLYVVLRDVIPESEAANLYGEAAVQDKSQMDGNPGLGAGSQLYEAGLPNWVMDITNPGEAERMRNVRTAERFTVYVDRHPDTLPEGLQLVVVGNALVWGPDDLQFGVLPVVPVRDGSTDPSYFPRPIMEQWLDHQMQLNAALALFVNSIRVNASGRFMAHPDAITRETLLGGSVSVIEIGGPGPISDQIMPVQGFSVGQDVKDFIQLKLKALEDATGYNDLSRGQISGDASGRAILAAREQLERTCAPPAQAMAKAYMQWAKIMLAGMAWGYDVPRDLGTIGKGRPDLARALSAKDFQGPTTVKVEEETLMPMPKAYRLFMLDNWHDKGIINNQQYMRRAEFGIISDIATPDEDQEARAKRMADALRLGMPPSAPRWTDNEAIFQDVLEREILLQDDLDEAIVAQATAVWTQYANQAIQKQGGAPPGGAPAPAGAPSAPVPGPHGSPFTPGPATMPVGASHPSIPVAPTPEQAFESHQVQ